MKKCFVWALAPALVLGSLSCKKKDAPDQAGDPGTSAEQPAKPQGKDPVVPAGATLSAEKRAEVVGFAAHVPVDTEYLISLHNGSDAAARLKGSKVWKTFTLMSGMPVDAEGLADEVADELVMGGPADMFGKEYTIAMGKGTGDQLKNLTQARSRTIYHLMTELINMFSAEISEQEGSSVNREMAFFSSFFTNLLEDEKSGLGLFEKTNMPPMYVAFKTDEENRGAVLQQLSGNISSMNFLFEDFLDEAKVTRADQVFSGYQLVGSKIAKQLEENKEDMQEVMPSATADRLIETIAKKDLYVVTGIHGDYVVLFVGSSLDDLVFADNVSSSLAGGSALEFVDAYAQKDLCGISYGQPEGFEAVVDLIKGILTDLSQGVRNGLANSDQFGDTRNIDALLRMVEEREAALESLADIHGGGTVVFFDDGIKVESYGGYGAGFINWQAQNRLAPLGDQEDVMFFVNFTSNADYDAKLRDYIETVFETAYAVAMKMSELPIEDGGINEIKGHMQLFDTKFREDLLAFWDAFSNGFNGSLGQERALLVDLQGGMPAIPGIPQEVVDSAKFPRASWMAPVKDRSKLAGSWEKMNGSMTKMSASISEILEMEIPMQKPMSSEKDGSVTWFFPMNFFNDDFLPSVSVHDNWFVASTSKLQAVDLIEKAETGGDTTQGFIMKADFTELHQYAKEMAGLMAKNNEDLPIGEKEMKQVNMVIEGLSEFNSMNIHVRREAGQLRSSFHIKIAGE